MSSRCTRSLKRKLFSFMRTERVEPQGAEVLHAPEVFDRRRRLGIERGHLLPGENDMHGVAGRGLGTVEEHRHPGHFRKNEPLGLQGPDRAGQIGAIQENIDILRIAHGCFVDLGHPQLHGVAADHGVGDAGRVKQAGRALQT